MKKYFVEILVLAFTVSVCLSAFVFNDAWQNTNKLYAFGILILLYFGLRIGFSISDYKTATKIVGWIVVLTGLFEAVLGILQLYGIQTSKHVYFGLTGTFYNPGPFAGFIASVVPLSLWFLLNNKNNKSFIDKAFIYTNLITIALILILLPATKSRAAWIASIVGCSVIFYNQGKPIIIELNRKHPARFKTVLIGVCTTLIIALAAVYLFKKDSADGRLLTWKISLKVALKHPLGVGLGNFSGTYGDEQAAYFESGVASEQEKYIAGCPAYAYNEFLQILVESGILATILFALIVIIAFSRLLKINIGLAGSLNDKELIQNKKISLAVFVFVLSIFTFISISYYPYYTSRKEWKNYQFLYYQNDFEEVVKIYEPLACHITDDIEFLYQYAISLGSTGHFEKSNQFLKRAMTIACDPLLYNTMGINYQNLTEYKQAESCFVKASFIIPSRVYPWYLLMNLYAETGQSEKALKTAELVLTKGPKVHSKTIEAMKRDAEILLNDAEK